MTTHTRIAVTGAGGFVGRTLVRALGGRAMALDRTALSGDITIAGAVAVVHLAGRAHRFNDTDRDAYVADNVALTARVLRAAYAAKVTRFVFVSTIGVHGTATHGTPFRESDTPAPHNIYAETKWAGEQLVMEFCAAHGMEWCVIRPPLVYGPNAPGNIGKLQKLVRAGVPLPFQNSDNRRSLIAVDYLGAILHWAATAPNAANRLFLVSDGIDRSTGGLLQTLAAQMGMHVRLFPFSQKILRFIAGKRFAPLWDDLQIDATAIHRAMRDGA
jgi:nucleoside-diphosphate-sugar epimerase